jgi:hypothetical protein
MTGKDTLYIIAELKIAKKAFEENLKVEIKAFEKNYKVGISDIHFSREIINCNDLSNRPTKENSHEKIKIKIHLKI